ncbi:hypothetical protein Tco_0387128 [Tanacetum coccineum]
MANAQGLHPSVQELTSTLQAPLVSESAEQPPPITEQVPHVSTALVVHASEEKPSEEKTSEEEPPSKRLKFLIPNPSATTPTPLSPISPQNMTVEHLNTPQLLLETKAKLEEMKRLATLKVEKEKSEKKLKKWIEIHALASKNKTKSNDILFRNLKAKFEWIKTQAGKLGIPPPPELTLFGLSAAEKKRKRSSEIIQEVFVKEDIVVDGMHRNLIPPPRVEGSRRLVIKEPESRIFFYNGNFNLVFQREEEFHLATTDQLIRT